MKIQSRTLKASRLDSAVLALHYYQDSEVITLKNQIMASSSVVLVVLCCVVACFAVDQHAIPLHNTAKEGVAYPFVGLGISQTLLSIH